MIDSSGSMLLTTSVVADLLDIHPSTVKRWSEDGVIPTERTEGGHRRFYLQKVLAAGRTKGIRTFLDPFHPWEANVWRAVSQASESGSFRRFHSLAMGWLRQGETDLLARLIHTLGDRPEIPFPGFLDEGIRGFMAQVGREWEGGRLQVGEEHMATQLVLEALIRLRSGWDAAIRPPEVNPGPTRPVAVVGAMEGDTHELGAMAVRVLLEREGWKVYYLGADVPMEELAAVQEGQSASLVCVSFSPRNTLPDVQRAVRILSEFYRPRQPYALALGGSLGDLPDPVDLPRGPFEGLSVSGSAAEFRDWVRTLPQTPGSNDLESGRAA